MDWQVKEKIIWNIITSNSVCTHCLAVYPRHRRWTFLAHTFKYLHRSSVTLHVTKNIVRQQNQSHKQQQHASVVSQKVYDCSLRVALSTTVHCRPWPRPSSGQRAVHEAACHESCCYLLLPSMPASPDPAACRQWNRYSTSPCTGHI